MDRHIDCLECSVAARDFLRALLQRDPSKRVSATQALQLPVRLLYSLITHCPSHFWAMKSFFVMDSVSTSLPFRCMAAAPPAQLNALMYVYINSCTQPFTPSLDLLYQWPCKNGP